jgi:hypothetical protein
MVAVLGALWAIAMKEVFIRLQTVELPECFFIDAKQVVQI